MLMKILQPNPNQKTIPKNKKYKQTHTQDKTFLVACQKLANLATKIDLHLFWNDRFFSGLFQPHIVVWYCLNEILCSNFSKLERVIYSYFHKCVCVCLFVCQYPCVRNWLRSLEIWTPMYSGCYNIFARNWNVNSLNQNS